VPLPAAQVNADGNAGPRDRESAATKITAARNRLLHDRTLWSW
jgi:hypothetical protein